MDRSAIGFLVGAVLLGAASLYLFVRNGQLQGEVVELQSDLQQVQTERDEAAKKIRRARVALGKTGAKGSGGAAKGAKASGKQTRRAPGPNRLPVQPKGTRPAHERAPGAAADPAAVAARAKLKEEGLDRMLASVKAVGAERGWTPSQIDQVSGIIEDSFTESGAIREQVHSRKLEPTEARAQLTAIRDVAIEEMTAVVGEEDHAALRDRMRSDRSLAQGE